MRGLWERFGFKSFKTWSRYLDAVDAGRLRAPDLSTALPAEVAKPGGASPQAQRPALIALPGMVATESGWRDDDGSLWLFRSGQWMRMAKTADHSATGVQAALEAMFRERRQVLVADAPSPDDSAPEQPTPSEPAPAEKETDVKPTTFTAFDPDQADKAGPWSHTLLAEVESYLNLHDLDRENLQDRRRALKAVLAAHPDLATNITAGDVALVLKNYVSQPNTSKVPASNKTDPKKAANAAPSQAYGERMPKEETLTVEAVAAREGLDLKDPRESARARTIYASESAGGAPLYGGERLAADRCGGVEVWSALLAKAREKGIDLARAFPYACQLVFAERPDLARLAALYGEGDAAVEAVASRHNLTDRNRAVEVLMHERKDLSTYGSGARDSDADGTVLLAEARQEQFDTLVRTIGDELHLRPDTNYGDRKTVFAELAKRRPEFLDGGKGGPR